MAAQSSASLFGHIQTLSKGNRRKAEEQKRGNGGGRFGTLTVQPRAVHNLFMSLARVAPQSKQCHDLLMSSERLESQGLATDGDLTRLQLLHARFSEIDPSPSCKCDPIDAKANYTVGEWVEVFRSEHPRLWVPGVVNKLDRAQRLALVEYQLIHEDDKSDARCQVWFRIDDQIRALQPSEPLDMEPTVTCPILWLRAFFAACAPDVLVYLLQVAAVTAYSPSALVPATPIPGHRSRPSGRHVRSASGSQWIFAASADTPQAKALLLEEAIAKQELIVQLLWKCDWLIRRGFMDRCCGDLWPASHEVNRRWFDGNFLVSCIDRVARAAPVPKAVVRMLFSIILGNDPMGGASKEKTLVPDLTETLGFTKPLVKSELHVLPSVLLAITKTTVSIAREGLQLLNMLVIRVEDNCFAFLSHEQWVSWFGTLLTGRGGGPVYEATTVATSSPSEARSSVLRRGQSQHFSSAAVSSLNAGGPATAADGTELTDEDQAMSTILQLTISIVVLLLYRHFDNHNPQRAAKITMMTLRTEVSSDSELRALEGPGTHKSFATLLNDTCDCIEDIGGWNGDTISLIRVLLTALIIRIQSAARLFNQDAQHHSWQNFIELLSVCEDFMFYQPANPTRRPRALADRHWKNLGLHIAKTGACDDMNIAAKICECIIALKMNDMPDSPDLVPDPNHRQQVKRLKSTIRHENEFFTLCHNYMRDVVKMRAQTNGAALKQLSRELQQRRQRRTGQTKMFGRIRSSSIDKVLAVAAPTVETAGESDDWQTTKKPSLIRPPLAANTFVDPTGGTGSNSNGRSSGNRLALATSGAISPPRGAQYFSPPTPSSLSPHSPSSLSSSLAASPPSSLSNSASAMSSLDASTDSEHFSLRSIANNEPIRLTLTKKPSSTNIASTPRLVLSGTSTPSKGSPQSTVRQPRAAPAIPTSMLTTNTAATARGPSKQPPSPHGSVHHTTAATTTASVAPVPTSTSPPTATRPTKAIIQSALRSVVTSSHASSSSTSAGSSHGNGKHVHVSTSHDDDIPGPPEDIPGPPPSPPDDLSPSPKTAATSLDSLEAARSFDVGANAIALAIGADVSFDNSDGDDSDKELAYERPPPPASLPSRSRRGSLADDIDSPPPSPPPPEDDDDIPPPPPSLHDGVADVASSTPPVMHGNMHAVMADSDDDMPNPVTSTNGVSLTKKAAPAGPIIPPPLPPPKQLSSAELLARQQREAAERERQYAAERAAERAERAAERRADREAKLKAIEESKARKADRARRRAEKEAKRKEKEEAARKKASDEREAWHAAEAKAREAATQARAQRFSATGGPLSPLSPSGPHHAPSPVLLGSPGGFGHHRTSSVSRPPPVPPVPQLVPPPNQAKRRTTPPPIPQMPTKYTVAASSLPTHHEATGPTADALAAAISRMAKQAVTNASNCRANGHHSGELSVPAHVSISTASTPRTSGTNTPILPSSPNGMPSPLLSIPTSHSTPSSNVNSTTNTPRATVAGVAPPIPLPPTRRGSGSLPIGLFPASPSNTGTTSNANGSATPTNNNGAAPPVPPPPPSNSNSNSNGNSNVNTNGRMTVAPGIPPSPSTTTNGPSVQAPRIPPAPTLGVTTPASARATTCVTNGNGNGNGLSVATSPMTPSTATMMGGAPPPVPAPPKQNAFPATPSVATTPSATNVVTPTAAGAARISIASSVTSPAAAAAAAAVATVTPNGNGVNGSFGGRASPPPVPAMPGATSPAATVTATSPTPTGPSRAAPPPPVPVAPTNTAARPTTATPPAVPTPTAVVHSLKSSLVLSPTSTTPVSPSQTFRAPSAALSSLATSQRTSVSIPAPTGLPPPVPAAPSKISAAASSSSSSSPVPVIPPPPVRSATVSAVRICAECGKVAASLHCVQCNGDICATCNDATHASILLRKHVRVPL